MTKTIGGEAELEKTDSFFYMTDSGRSSLRLILRSGLKNKKFLLPDFLCGVILDIFNEEGVKYDFYGVNEDLYVNRRDIRAKKHDVLYLIDYFGRKYKDIGGLLNDKNTLVIEDCVFSPLLEKPDCLKHWIGFNSLRKISYLAEGSMIESTRKLRGSLVLKREAPFAKMKYEAKAVKYEYLKHKKYSEERYLRMFSAAEKALDAQKAIYSVSNETLSILPGFYRNMDKEYRIRKRNFDLLDGYLKDVSIDVSPVYPSFYVLLTDRRDEMRGYLRSHRVYLPVHWPAIRGMDNSLYRLAISIPVDSRYSEADMAFAAKTIRKFLKRKNKHNS